MIQLLSPIDLTPIWGWDMSMTQWSSFSFSPKGVRTWWSWGGV